MSELPYYRPSRMRDQEGLMKNLRKLIRDGRYTKGRLVDEFAAKMSEMTSYEYVIPVGQGTHAIFLLARWYKELGYDRLVSPAFTWRSTWEPFKWAGFRVQFVDIDRETWLPDFEGTTYQYPNLRTVFAPTDTFGSVFPYRDIPPSAATPWVDSAQSLGAGWDSLQPHRVVSLSGSKPLTSGEGGFLLTQDRRLYEFAKEQAHWFSRMNELEAALGLAYLGQFYDDLQRRIRIEGAYKERFRPPRFRWQEVPVDTNRYIVAALVGRRKGFVEANPGVEFRRYYAPVVSEKDRPGDEFPTWLPNTRRVASRIVAFPAWPDLPLKRIKEMRE